MIVPSTTVIARSAFRRHASSLTNRDSYKILVIGGGQFLL